MSLIKNLLHDFCFISFFLLRFAPTVIYKILIFHKNCSRKRKCVLTTHEKINIILIRSMVEGDTEKCNIVAVK